MRIRKSIRLAEAHVEILRDLYVKIGLPLDRYVQSPDQSRFFMKRWFEKTGRSDEWDDLLHFMITRRKRGEWVRLSKQDRMESGSNSYHTVDQRFSEVDQLPKAVFKQLETAYQQVVLNAGYGSDRLQFDPELLDRLVTKFHELSGLNYSGAFLLERLIERRKEGSLNTLRPKVNRSSKKTKADDSGSSDLPGGNKFD